MAIDLEQQQIESQDEPFVYRALSAAAVSCFAFSLLSLLAFFDWWLVLIPVLGIVIGIYALSLIRQRPDEFTGRNLAVFGILISVFALIGSLVLHTYIYMTEVPEGFLRTSWEKLQVEDSANTNQLIPRSAAELDGKQVFIKGYIYPITGGRKSGIRHFLLVRDQGDCCFGGNPKITERIQVTMADPRGATFTSGVCKVAGIFRIKPLPQVAGAQGVKRGVIYHLKEVEIR